MKIVIVLVILAGTPKIFETVMLRKQRMAAMKDIEDQVSAINLALPQKVDRFTTLTKVDLSKDLYRVSYTMSPDAPIEAGNKDVYQAIAVKQVCNTSYKKIIDNKISIEYIYTYTKLGGGDAEMIIRVPPGSCS